jgi:hypothetical protein
MPAYCRQLTLITFLLTLFISVKAQTNYQPASVTLINGQQVAGWIDYRQWNQNPHKISFRKTPDGETLLYGTSDLQSFMITGKDSFERAVVTKDMRPVELAQVSGATEDREETDTTFLRILLKNSQVALYELVDFKLHLFVRENNSDFNELKYKVYFDAERSVLSYQNLFRAQLQKYLEGNLQQGKWVRYLEHARYATKDITVFIAGVNDMKIPKQKTTNINFFVGGGAVYSSIKFKGSSDLDRMSYKGGVGPSVGLGMDLRSTRNLQDVTVRLEIFYSSAHYKGEGTTYLDYPTTYTIDQTNITPAFAVLYNFLRSPAYKVYIGGGLGYNFSSYSRNRYTMVYNGGNSTFINDNYLNFEKSWVEVTGRVGGFIGKKIELSLIGKIVGGFNNLIYISGNPTTFSLRVGYHFGK